VCSSDLGDLTSYDADRRIREAMKEDGFSDKEIDEYLQSKASKNDTLLECFQKEEEKGEDD
jgi:hypothetical protein